MGDLWSTLIGFFQSWFIGFFAFFGLLFPSDEYRSQTLRQAASGTGIHIGVALKPPNFSDLPDLYYAIASDEFSSVTAENHCKMSYIAKDWTDFDFTDCNSQYQWALANDQQFRFHVLVWARANSNHKNPQFINESEDDDAKEQFMIDYITAVMNEYGESIYAYDVINEALGDHDHPYKGIDDWFCKAFKAARAANPSSQLFYNDFGILATDGWRATKSDLVYETIKNATERGDDCPIDGVGFQGHLDIDFSDESLESAKENIKRYADLGIIVHLTEIDIQCSKVTWDADCTHEVWPEEDLQKQANLYSALLQMCLEAWNCEAFTMWGFTDAESWLAAPKNGLPWDDEYYYKPAHSSMIDTLDNFDRSHPAAVTRTSKNRGL